MADLEFFFDPVCPFAWQTSRWIRQVARVRDVDVEWRFISLRMVNAETDYDGFPPHYEDAHTAGQHYLRVAAAIRDRHGADAVGAFYEAVGNELWNRTPDEQSLEGIMGALAAGLDLPGILERLGLDADLADAFDDDKWDKVLRDETDLALSRAGKDVGTPILSFDGEGGNSFFGPVISELPTDDDEAVAIYDAVRTLAAYPTFSELKRSIRPDLDLPLLKG